MKIKKQVPSVENKTEGRSHFYGSASDSLIHPTAILGPEVTVGANVVIGPYTVITGNTKIGDGTRIYSHVSIGYPAQDLGTKESRGTIEIGSNCTIREFTSIHASKKDDGKTVIGNNCYIMTSCQLAHDVILEDDVTLISQVQLGGHVYVERKAFLMVGAAVHQFCRIGQFAALGPFSGIRQDLPPFGLFNGQPAEFAGLNRLALKRANFTQESIEALKHVTFLFYQKKLLLEDIEILASQETLWGSDSHVQAFIHFIKESTRGVSRKVLREKTGESV